MMEGAFSPPLRGLLPLRNAMHPLLCAGSSHRSLASSALPSGYGNGNQSTLSLEWRKTPKVCFKIPCNRSSREGLCAFDFVGGIRGFEEQTGSLKKMPKIGVTALAAAVVGFAIPGNAMAVVESCERATATEFNWIIILAEAIALTGAAVGGILARQRKKELETINEQLRKINGNLRRQARVESYAPSLTYAPVGGGRVPDVQVYTDPDREVVLQLLRSGKRWLRETNPIKAFGEFEKALSLARGLKDAEMEKKAARGLGASCQRQGKYKEAIKYHTLVLTVSQLTGENSGDTEALGAIADCYTELGDLETAAKVYDRYIDQLENDED